MKRWLERRIEAARKLKACGQTLSDGEIDRITLADEIERLRAEFWLLKNSASGYSGELAAEVIRICGRALRSDEPYDGFLTLESLLQVACDNPGAAIRAAWREICHLRRSFPDNQNEGYL